MLNNLGYTKNLFILPFDHRSSFLKIFSDTASIVSAKWIIYEAFKKAVSDVIQKEEAAILVDEQYGDKILIDAKEKGFITILTTEKSGQKEFAFEYGTDFNKHTEKYNPTFAKALIHYNPQDDEQSKIRQQQQLKILSDYCHDHGYKFLLEVLIPPPSTSEESFGLRKLQVLAIEELQTAGIEPDVWKLEGTKEVKDYQIIVNQVQKDARKNVGVVVLGRGENQSLVEEWIRAGARVDGVIGFAIGRTVFWQPLMDLKNGTISKEETINQIANNFKYFYDIFMANKTLAI